MKPINTELGHIHSVIVSYNRKLLTEQTLQSYLETGDSDPASGDE